MSETSLKLWGIFLDVSSSSKLQSFGVFFFFFEAFFFVRCGDVRRSVWGGWSLMLDVHVVAAGCRRKSEARRRRRWHT